MHKKNVLQNIIKLLFLKSQKSSKRKCQNRECKCKKLVSGGGGSNNYPPPQACSGLKIQKFKTFIINKVTFITLYCKILTQAENKSHERSKILLSYRITSSHSPKFA